MKSKKPQPKSSPACMSNDFYFRSFKMRILQRLQIFFGLKTKQNLDKKSIGKNKAVFNMFPKNHPLAKFRPDQLTKLAGVWVPKSNQDKYLLPEAYKKHVLKAFKAYSTELKKTEKGRQQLQAILGRDMLRIDGVYVPRCPILQELPHYKRQLSMARYYARERMEKALEMQRKQRLTDKATARLPYN